MKTPKNAKIAILGISQNPDRYSNKAMQRLIDSGYDSIIGINPATPVLPGIHVVAKIGDITDAIHTLTVYVGKEILDSLTDVILKLRPKRVILNPGTESEAFAQKASDENIEVIEACTLVLLSTGEF